MADINVQRKGSNILPLLIGLLLVGLLGWALLSFMGGNENRERTTVEETTTGFQPVEMEHVLFV